MQHSSDSTQHFVSTLSLAATSILFRLPNDRQLSNISPRKLTGTPYFFFKSPAVKMTGKFQTEFKTPWALMKGSEEWIPKIFAPTGPSEPFAAPGSMTYFNNEKGKSRQWQGRVITVYDRIHDKTPFNPKQQRCDRMQPGLIWAGIHEENKGHKVPINTSHWHGRPNRIQLDFPDSKFYRSNKIQDQFYRRYNINIDSDLDRQCQTY